jgi:hypothetical protein
MESDPVLLDEDHHNPKKKQANHQAKADGEEQETQFFSPQGAIEPWEKDSAQKIKDRFAAMA